MQLTNSQKSMSVLDSAVMEAKRCGSKRRESVTTFGHVIVRTNIRASKPLTPHTATSRDFLLNSSPSKLQIFPSHHMKPISTREWTFADLLKQGERFHPVPRSKWTSEDLESRMKQYEESGAPFVIEGWNQHPRWPKKTFDVDFCRQYFRSRNEGMSI